MKNYPIKEIKFYQAIKLEGASTTFVTPSQYMSVRSNKKELNLQIVDAGVMVETDKECVLVGWPNIAYITLDKSAEDPPAPAKKVK